MSDVLRWFRRTTEKKKPSKSAKYFKSFFSESDDNELGILRSLEAERSAALEDYLDNIGSFLKSAEICQRVSDISKKNQHRRVLVVPFATIDNRLLDRLLTANSNAEVVFTSSVAEGIEKLNEQEFDLVYMVTAFREGPDLPCVVPLDDPRERRKSEAIPHIESYEGLLRRHSGNAEIVAVCGNSSGSCPVDFLNGNSNAR